MISPLDAETHRVTRADAEVKLGPTEFRLLATFMEKPGRVWSREALLDRVWGRDVYVDTRTVDVHVGRLRKALSQAGGDRSVAHGARGRLRLRLRLVFLGLFISALVIGRIYSQAVT